jgi:2-ketocyclohexanecarboxyl-CoA hydrolase
MDFQDILYDVRNGVAWITINRPDKMNAFRGQTCDELIKALNKAGYDKAVGAIVLAGAGDRAFCTGGDRGQLRRPRHHRPADGGTTHRHS